MIVDDRKITEKLVQVFEELKIVDKESRWAERKDTENVNSPIWFCLVKQQELVLKLSTSWQGTGRSLMSVWTIWPPLTEVICLVGCYIWLIKFWNGDWRHWRRTNITRVIIKNCWSSGSVMDFKFRSDISLFGYWVTFGTHFQSVFECCKILQYPNSD